jgi:hypothetical protein
MNQNDQLQTTSSSSGHSHPIEWRMLRYSNGRVSPQTELSNCGLRRNIAKRSNIQEIPKTQKALAKVKVYFGDGVETRENTSLRLAVAHTFLPPHSNPKAIHVRVKDGDPFHLCETNLEWCTKSELCRAYQHPTQIRGNPIRIFQNERDEGREFISATEAIVYIRQHLRPKLKRSDASLRTDINTAIKSGCQLFDHSWQEVDPIPPNTIWFHHPDPELGKHYKCTLEGKFWGRNNRFRQPSEKCDGYILMDGHQIHQLVYACVNGVLIPDDREIDHIDKEKCNNHSKNLRLVTGGENVQASYDSGTTENACPVVKITSDGIVTHYNSYAEAARHSPDTVKVIRRYCRDKDVSPHVIEYLLAQDWEQQEIIEENVLTETDIDDDDQKHMKITPHSHKRRCLKKA